MEAIKTLHIICEALMKMGIIIIQRAFLLKQKYPLYGKYVFEYDKDENGLDVPTRVLLREATDNDRDEQIVLIRKGCEISLNKSSDGSIFFSRKPFSKFI